VERVSLEPEAVLRREHKDAPEQPSSSPFIQSESSSQPNEMLIVGILLSLCNPSDPRRTNGLPALQLPRLRRSTKTSPCEQIDVRWPKLRQGLCRITSVPSEAAPMDCGCTSESPRCGLSVSGTLGFSFRAASPPVVTDESVGKVNAGHV